MHSLSPDRLQPRLKRLLGGLLFLTGACHATAAAPVAERGQRPVRVASAGTTPPVQGEPPVSIFSGEAARRLPPAGTRLTCPVCGDEFAVEDGQPLRHYKGKVVLFCCERCLPHFDKNPELFVGKGL